jgi:hypothetical protein
MGRIRIRKNTDEWEDKGTNKKIVTLSDAEIIRRALEKQERMIVDRRKPAGEEYKEEEEISKEELVRELEEQEEVKLEEKERRRIIDKRYAINSDEELEEGLEEEIPKIVEIVEKENDRGYRRNKPRMVKSTYQRGREEITKEELKSNATGTFISHNFNKDKWWNDPQIKKEVWKTKNLTKMILGKAVENLQRIQELRETKPANAMKLIQRIMMQMHSWNRKTNDEDEEKLIEYKGLICLEALKIEAPMGNLRTIRMIIKSIESTFIRSDEFLIMKAEIMIRTREWREAALAINGIGKNNEIMKEDWVRRVEEIKENIKKNDDLEKRNKTG